MIEGVFKGMENYKQMHFYTVSLITVAKDAYKMSSKSFYKEYQLKVTINLEEKKINK